MARNARPRPDCSMCTARTSPNSRASPSAIDQVASVLPLSAIVTRAVNGKPSRRKAIRRRMLGARSCSSLRTGTTMSTCRTLMAMRIGDHLRRRLKRPYVRAMSKAATPTHRHGRRVESISNKYSSRVPPAGPVPAQATPDRSAVPLDGAGPSLPVAAPGERAPEHTGPIRITDARPGWFRRPAIAWSGGHRNRHVTAPRSPKSAWITSPERTKTGRVNDPDKITCPAGRSSS